MKLSKISKALFASLVISNSINAYAEESNLNINKDNMVEIVVEGTYLSLDKLNSVKTPTPIIDVPQSLSILSAEQIKQQAFSGIGDVLRYTPGLSVSQGEGHRDSAIIRGIQTTADFFIDGVRDDVQYYRPLYNVEQVEVLRGSNALLFGRGGGGGVINRVTKQSKIGEQFSSVNAGVDSFGGYSIAGDTNFIASDNTAVRLNGFYKEHKNHRDSYEGRTFAFNPNIKIQTGEKTSFVASYEYLDDSRVVDRGVPSQKTGDVNTPLTGYSETFFGAPNDNLTTNEAHIVRAKIDHEFSKNLRTNVSAQYADYDKFYQNLYTSSSVTLVDGKLLEAELDGYKDKTDRKNLIIQANLVGEFDAAGLGHTILFGSEFGNQDTTNARFDNVFATNNSDKMTVQFNQNLVIPEFSFSKPARDRESDISFASIYLQDQIDLTENFKLVAGLRYDQFEADVLDNKEANNGDNNTGQFNRKDSELTKRYGAIYKPEENVSIYASYGETFLPRSGEQFLTLDLESQSTRPQFFENKEIGLKWDITPDLSFTTSVFDLNRESYTSVDPTDASKLITVEGSNTSGVELQLVGDLTDTWNISTGYSYLDGKVERVDGSGNNDNKTRQTPENMFSIWNNLDVTPALSFGLGATYQDSFFVSEDNSVEVPSYTRVDAAAYYQLSDATRIQLNVENLLDKEYFPDAHNNNNISTGKPLNATLSVTMDF